MDVVQEYTKHCPSCREKYRENRRVRVHYEVELEENRGLSQDPYACDICGTPYSDSSRISCLCCSDGIIRERKTKSRTF